MKLPAINITKEALSRFDEALQKEWLLTNGLGGYASSTILGINTRKYHGLLVAALHPPRDRTVILAKLDENVFVGNMSYSLGANEFHDKIFPQGYLFLKEFSVAPLPTYVYSVQNVEIAKTVFMPREKNAVAVIYKVLNDTNSRIEFRVFPLLNCRHFHSVVDRMQSPLDMSQQQNSKEVEVTVRIPKATIVVRATEGEFIEKTNWIERLYYREEDNRGESSIDDCYQPGYFQIPIGSEQKAEFAIVTAANENSQKSKEDSEYFGTKAYDVESLIKLELEQRADALAKFYIAHKQIPITDWLNWILLAADTFIVKSVADRKSVVAGYFWFEAWGRDTFISLPGLMLVTGRFEDARRILLNFMEHCRHGLIPNCVEDKCGELFYNTVDATLWYFNAVLQYLKYTGDYKFVQKQLWDRLKTIIESHMQGTAFGIRLDSDGLLMHGSRLTWMDAEMDDKAVTPRAGKAVEIQALWYNALRTMQLLASRFGERTLAEKYAEAAAKAQASFDLKFWNNEKSCLFDVVASSADATVRPNQVIAVALDFTMLDGARSGHIVDTVHRELLTPCGLRTLAQGEREYRGVYFGDRRSRDMAYHNGTVWAWLLGPFITAFLKTKGYSDQAREYALRNMVMPLFAHQVFQAGLGTVSEVFDGDAPHTPRGCIAQAWSVAEPLRAYVEDVMFVRPKHESDVLQVK